MGIVAACARPPAPIAVDRFETAVVVGLDGTLDVTEEIAVPVAAAGQILTRRIAPVEADSIALQATRVDGAYHGGVPEGLTAESRGKHLTVTWLVPGSPASPHVLAIVYRVFAALRVDEPRAYLAWRALDRGHGLDVAAARLTLTLPPGMPFYEGTGVAEAGWTVERRSSGIVATRGGLTGNDRATLLADVDLKPSMTEGQWQIDEERQRNLLPAYASGGLFMLVIAVGIQWILRAQHPRRGQSVSPDPERVLVARGLRTSAGVGTLVALACSAFAYVFLPRLGPWIQLIPAGMIVAALLFVVFARRWQAEGAGMK
jgi:hypothetical protein